MRIYDRDPKTNDLTLVKKISTHSGCDNLEIAEDGKTVYLGYVRLCFCVSDPNCSQYQVINIIIGAGVIPKD